MQIPELVPQVLVFERNLVSLFDGVASSDGLEHGQMRRSRLVQTGEESVDDANAALGRDDQVSPAAGADDLAVRIDAALQRPNDRGADGDHAPAARLRVANALGGAKRHFVPLFVRRLMRFETGHSRVEQQSRDADAKGAKTSK